MFVGLASVDNNLKLPIYVMNYIVTLQGFRKELLSVVVIVSKDTDLHLSLGLSDL